MDFVLPYFKVTFGFEDIEIAMERQELRLIA